MMQKGVPILVVKWVVSIASGWKELVADNICSAIFLSAEDTLRDWIYSHMRSFENVRHG